MEKTKAQKVIDIAFAEAKADVKEIPANSNKTKYGEWFGLNGEAWCGIFVSWCYAQAGVPLGKIGYIKGYAGCQTAVLHFQKTGEVTKNPQVGDIVFFDWNGDKRYDHTAIFNGWVKDKKGQEFYTVEGNTSLTNQSNGGQVMVRQRGVLNVVFVHPKVLD